MRILTLIFSFLTMSPSSWAVIYGDSSSFNCYGYVVKFHTIGLNINYGTGLVQSGIPESMDLYLDGESESVDEPEPLSFPQITEQKTLLQNGDGGFPGSVFEASSGTASASLRVLPDHLFAAYSNAQLDLRLPDGVVAKNILLWCSN